MLVLAGVVALVVGINYLKGNNVFGNQRIFYAVYRNIGGLLESNPITINGFKVGQVSKIAFIPDNSGRLVVTLMIDDPDIQFPLDTRARIYSSDLLGSKAVELQLGKNELYAMHGDTLKSDIETDLRDAVNQQIKPLKDKSEELVANIDSMITTIGTFLNDDTRDKFRASMNSISSTTRSLAITTSRLDTLVAQERIRIANIFRKVEIITSGLANSSDALSNAIYNISNISDSLARVDLIQTVESANRVLAEVDSIMTKVDNGEGTLGMLVNNDELYNRLTKSSAALENLLEDMRINPHRYLNFSLIGRKDKGLRLTPREERQLRKILKKEE